MNIDFGENELGVIEVDMEYAAPAPVDPLEEERLPDGPFDIARIPEHHHVNDPVDQADIYDAIQRGVLASSTRDFAIRFNAMTAKRIQLSHFRSLVDGHHQNSAIQSLSTRTRVQVDDNLMFNAIDDDVVPVVKDHRLDFMLYFGSRVGLDAILPHSHQLVDHRWHFTLTFAKMFKLWPETLATLPFSTTGRMMHIGYIGQEEVWIAMVPHSLVSQENAPPNMTALAAPSSSLTTEHAYMIVLFIASLLSDLHFQDIYCRNKYPEPPNIDHVRNSTDILGRLHERNRALELNLADARALHEGISQRWFAWVRNAPRSWKRDSFLSENVPVALTMRYGQNQPICDPQGLEQERRVWNDDRDLSHIRLMCFSIAHHIAFQRVETWRDVPDNMLFRVFPNIFDRPDDDPLRAELHLQDLLGGAVDRDATLYDTDGFRIRRKIPLRFTESGALVDLCRVQEIFPPNNEGRSTFNPYPIGFTKTFGHVQARRIVQSFDLVTDRINTTLSPPINEGANIRRGTPIVRGTHSQIYNVVSHRVRNAARFHYVQLGLLTSVLAGTTATTGPHKRKFEQRRRHCVDGGLPHQRHAFAIDGENQPQEVRLEQTFSVDLFRLRQQHRTGGSIYDNIIKPICRFVLHPRVLRPILRCLQPFVPEVIPNLCKWTTYPITSLIELMWEERISALDEPAYEISPYDIEFMSALERTLNYAHTGAARVLSQKLMAPMFMSMGIVSDGFPTINSNFFSFGGTANGSVVVHSDHWPVVERTLAPVMCSWRCQELTYSAAHAEASQARLTIHHSLRYLPEAAFADIPDNNIRVACNTIEIAFRVYIKEVKKLVSEAILKELEPLLSSHRVDVRIAAEEREQKLSVWLKEPHPLTYADPTLSYLLRAISPKGPDGTVTMRLKSARGNGEPLSFLVRKLINGIERTRELPFIQGGAFCRTLSIAISEITKTCRLRGLSADETSNFIEYAVTHVCKHLKINHVPWSADPAPGSRGAPSKVVVHSVWLPLGQAEPPRLHPGSTILTLQESRDMMASQQSGLIQLNDRRAEWSAMNVKLIHYYQVVHKDSLPKEWGIQNASISGSDIFGLEMYNWVRNNFSPSTTSLHALALFISLVFTGLLPDVFLPTSVNADHLATHQIPQFMKTLPWTSRTRKGLKSPLPFITMVTAFIILVGDSNSPLNEPLEKVHSGSATQAMKNNVESFFKKHTQKGISIPNTLIRFGLATPHTNRVFTGGQWNRDFTLRRKIELDEKWSQVKERLISGREYGGYNAVACLAGNGTADKLRDNNWVKVIGYTPHRPVPSASASSSSLGKRRHTVDPSSDDDVVMMSEIGVLRGCSQRRRK